MHNKKLWLCKVITFPPASLPYCLVVHAPYCVEITCFSLAGWEMPQLGFADTFALSLVESLWAVRAMAAQDFPATFKKEVPMVMNSIVLVTLT